VDAWDGCMGRGGGVECKVIMNKLKNEKKRRMGSSMVALTGKSVNKKRVVLRKIP
jgi:hypothetical protein